MTILYSDAIFAFLKKNQQLAKQILLEEMKIQVGRTRFFIKNTSYPLHFVTFEHPSKLGYFQADLYEIGVNKSFLFENEEKLKNLLRHELAHYITFIEYGPHVPHHGKEFQKICKRYGWDTQISRAVIKVEAHAQTERILEKVHKLFSLANSPHPEEAQAATLKAKELLLKYNLKIDPKSDEMRLVRILPSKRNSSKIQAIASILRTFFVYPVFNRGKGRVYLEIVGSKVNVEVAEYIAYFLEKKFDDIWKEAKKLNPVLRGTASKNTFFRGLAEGYLQKSSPSSQALIRIENQLIQSAQKIYPHLVHSKRSLQHHEIAAKIGREKGKNLIIQHGINMKNFIKKLT